MFKLTPIVLFVLYSWLYLRFSVWQTNRALNQQSQPLNDPALRPVLVKLAQALDLPRIIVHLHKIPQINGLAAPDGRIFITQGFIDKLRLGQVTDTEIASVIAHELGHVALTHSRRRMVDFGVQNAARAVLMGVIGRFIPFIGPWIANMVVGLLSARLSRQDEFEADEYASALLIKAGIGTGPQISLFEKLDTLAGGANTTPAWLLSHPKTPERIAAIKRNTAKWGG